MIRWEVSPTLQKFRAEFRAWLESRRVPSGGADSSLQHFVETGRKWQQELSSGRWVGVHWPEVHGGRGLSLVEEAVVQEELVRVGSPQLLGLFGLTMVGPVLIRYGTEEQKHRHLSSILSAQTIWCQGFSEPGAGSDLAAVRTKAVPAERRSTNGSALQRGFEITGQKIWTSFAQIADWCFALCRTGEIGDASGPLRHKGLTYFLIDMKSPGVSHRPLQQITGDSEFNEVFFDRVFVPEDCVVGAVGEGWKIAISTLMYERVVLTFARQLQSEVLLRSLLAQAHELSKSNKDELSRQVATACAVRALAYEHLDAYVHGAAPGPEGSMDKLLWSESFQELSRFAVDVCGADAVVQESSAERSDDAFRRYLYSRGRTIAAGTSEIQRTIIAERVLGLPRLSFSRAR